MNMLKFKKTNIKCPDLSEILPPIFAQIMYNRPSTKQILYVNNYETPCSSKTDLAILHLISMFFDNLFYLKFSWVYRPISRHQVTFR